jgi:MFS transporter, Spinster family, sphingosine-1-phosphate transporter
VAGGGAMCYHHLAAMIGILIGGRLSDVLVLRRPEFRLQLQTCAMLCGVPALVGMGLSQSLTGTWIAMAAVGLCRGLYESNTHAALFDVIAPRYRASAVAMMTMAAFLIGSLAPWLLGCCDAVWGKQNGLSYGFAAISAAYLIGGMAMLAAWKVTFRRDHRAEIEETN